MVDIECSTPGLAGLIDEDESWVSISSGHQCTEGPAWNVAGQYLEFSDIPGDSRWRWDEVRGSRRVMSPNYMGNGMVFEPDGGLLICEHVTSSVIRVLVNGDRQIVAYHFAGKYLNSPNDVVVRSDGSVYFSDPNYGRWPVWVGVERSCDLDFQGVFRVPPGGDECERVVGRDEFEQPNGLCFSPDESVLYVDDLDDVKAFDVAADGSLSHPRVLRAGLGAKEHQWGNPDGMKCDALGNVWVAANPGIWVIDPGGGVVGAIRTPETATNLAWGGPDLRSLFVTTWSTVRMIRTKVPAAPLPGHRSAASAGPSL